MRLQTNEQLPVQKYFGSEMIDILIEYSFATDGQLFNTRRN
jgi:hypothetical protein